MKIGIDLDGTITDFHRYIVRWTKIYLKNKGKRVIIKNKNAFHIEDIFDLSKEDIDKIKNITMKELRMKIKPRKGAIEVLKKLHESNNEI